MNRQVEEKGVARNRTVSVSTDVLFFTQHPVAADVRRLKLFRWTEFRASSRRLLRSQRAFTLIELILVLALLAVVTALAMPAMSRFFRGRALDSEARQLLSLTHAAQSRAVSDGFPMLLWIDPKERTYGVQQDGTVKQGNAQDVDTKAEEFTLEDRLNLEAVNATPITIN